MVLHFIPQKIQSKSRSGMLQFVFFLWRKILVPRCGEFKGQIGVLISILNSTNYSLRRTFLHFLGVTVYSISVIDWLHFRSLTLCTSFMSSSQPYTRRTTNPSLALIWAHQWFTYAIAPRIFNCKAHVLPLCHELSPKLINFYGVKPAEISPSMRRTHLANSCLVSPIMSGLQCGCMYPPVLYRAQK